MSDPAILTERLRGRTLRDLADATGMTPEGVRGVVIREGRKQIDRIELQLLAATKTGDVVAFLIPDHSGSRLSAPYLCWRSASSARWCWSW